MVLVDDAYEMVVNGTIVDAKTRVAILRLKSGTLDHLNDRSPRSITAVTVGHCNHRTIATYQITKAPIHFGWGLSCAMC